MIKTITSEQMLASDDTIAAVSSQLKVQFPTESDCFEKLCEIEGVQIECHFCGWDSIERKKGERSFVCSKCHKTSWVTAGSFFEHVRKFFPWLLLISLREKGININSNRFSRLAGIASSTAQVMYKKLSLVIVDYMKSGMSDVFSSDFLPLYGKRSRLTPASEHPVSEQLKANRRAYTQVDTSQNIAIKNLTGLQSKVLEAISDKPIHIDTLSKITHLPVEEISACLVILELEKLVSPKPGATYVRCFPTAHVEALGSSSSSTNSFNSAVKTITKFISREFHRLSRKYVQLYLSAIWSQLDIDTWGNGNLLLACQRFGKIPSSKLRNYDSPTVLKLWWPNV